MTYLSAALLLAVVNGNLLFATGQEPQLKVGERVDIHMPAGVGTILKIGTERPFVGCYFIHFDYQKNDANAGDWHCQNGSRPITALGAKPSAAKVAVRSTAVAAAPKVTRAAVPTSPAPERNEAVASVERGSYECYALSGSRLVPRMGLNFAITGASSYKGVDGKSGSFTLVNSTGAMVFRGGALDGQHAKYEGKNNKHLSTVNFVNKRGELGDACDRAG